MPLPIQFRCNACLELHDDYEDAKDCCAPGVDEVFVCPVCCGEYLSEEDALDCHETPEDFVPLPSPRQLEKYGQRRLLP